VKQQKYVHKILIIKQCDMLRIDNETKKQMYNYANHFTGNFLHS